MTRLNINYKDNNSQIAFSLKEKHLFLGIKERKGVKNMKKAILTISALVLTAGVLFAGASSVLAYRGDPGAQGPNCSPERHEAMVQAFENKDYNAWKNLMQGKGRVTEVINEGNFARFAEMHKLRLEGNTDEANKIRTELGLGLRDGAGYRQGRGYGRINR